jgi:predicted HTH transcriptional regulator
MNVDDLYDIIKNGEREFVEFKQNNDNPEMIGQYISAIANSLVHQNGCGPGSPRL